MALFNTKLYGDENIASYPNVDLVEPKETGSLPLQANYILLCLSCQIAAMNGDHSFFNCLRDDIDSKKGFGVYF